MEEKVSGIVLSAISYAENDKILSIFTLEKGVVSARIKGVKKAGAKLKFASEPFCFAEYILTRSRAGLTVINASLIDSFYPVREDIFKYYAGATVLEFVRRFYKENIVAPEAFLTVANGLKAIAYGNNPLSSLVTFLINALSDVGYALEISGCSICGQKKCLRMFFNYDNGSFYCENCFSGEGREINPQTFNALLLVHIGQEIERDGSIKALRLLDFYLENKTEERLTSLKELLKMLA